MQSFSQKTLVFSGQKQRGASLLGAALMIGLILFALIVAMKIVPAYVEYNNIKNILRNMVSTGGVTGLSKREIVDSFNKRKNIDDIQSVSGQDLDISTDEAGNTVIRVQYQVVRPVMGNVSALIDFDASSARK